MYLLILISPKFKEANICSERKHLQLLQISIKTVKTQNYNKDTVKK